MKHLFLTRHNRYHAGEWHRPTRLSQITGFLFAAALVMVMTILAFMQGTS